MYKEKPRYRKGSCHCCFHLGGHEHEGVYHDLYYCTREACLVWCCDPEAVGEDEEYTNIWFLELPGPLPGSCQHPLKLEATRRMEELLRQVLK